MQKRNTKTKQMVLSILEHANAALSHEHIEKQLAEQIDRVTIYRILQGFCEDGKVHKITGETGKTYYALCRNCSAGHHHDNHPHFRCVNCETITCIAEKSLTIPALPDGYTALSITSLVSGYCPSCRSLLQIAGICLLLLMTSFSSFAQPSTNLSDTTAHELVEIVVSDYHSKLQGETVIHVEKLSLNNSTAQGISLTEKLASVPGVNNLSTGAGIGKPVIRGLSGNRIAVFSQGIRIENQQWGDEHGLGLSENGYEHVEIIKGPASLLYGSDALGGVLYFVDEGWNTDEHQVNLEWDSEFNSNTQGWRNNGTFQFSKNRLHWNAFGGYTTHKDYQDGAGNFVPNSRFHTDDFKTVFGYTGNQWMSSLKYSFLNEQYGLTEPLEPLEAAGSPPEGDLGGSYQDLTTHLISSENTFFFPNDSKLKVDAGYVFNNRKEFEAASPLEGAGEEAPALNMNLGTLSYNAKWYSPKFSERWTLIAGSQGMYQTNTNHGEEELIPNATTTDLGVFAVSDFYYSGKSYAQIGVRVDHRQITTDGLSKSYTAFNFSMGVFQQLAEQFSFRANVASGYRAPNTFELLSNGVHEGTNRYEIGNRALKKENSYQVDASLNYKSRHLELFVSPYFNYIRNYIYIQPSDETREEVPVFYYTQADAYLYGGEAGFHFHPHPLDWLHLEGAYSSTFGEDKSHHALPLIPSQKINTTVSASFLNKKKFGKLSLYLQNQYSLAQNRVSNDETATPAYDLVNVGVRWELGTKCYFAIAVNNLFNEVYYDHLSRYKNDGIYNRGRNFNFRLSCPFTLQATK